MDDVLVEKAEVQQNLVLLRKENEMVKEREQVDSEDHILMQTLAW